MLLARLSGSVEYGFANGTVIVRLSTFFIPEAMMPCNALAASPGFLGLMTRLIEKIRSSAVTSLPLWKVTPERRRIVHTVASLLGVISSASR